MLPSAALDLLNSFTLCPDRVAKRPEQNLQKQMFDSLDSNTSQSGWIVSQVHLRHTAGMSCVCLLGGCSCCKQGPLRGHQRSLDEIWQHNLTKLTKWGVTFCSTKNKKTEPSIATHLSSIKRRCLKTVVRLHEEWGWGSRKKATLLAFPLHTDWHKDKLSSMDSAPQDKICC